jgi:hypothetical protein
MLEPSRPFARPVPRLRVAVLGAGPVGLEAALAAVERGHDLAVYEAAPHPAAHVRDWGHVRLFSPWRMNASRRMRSALAALGRPLSEDPDASPTGHELADRVLDPIWGAQPLRGALRLGTRVVAVGREGLLKHEEISSPERAARPFRILLRDGRGRESVEHADVVLDCTGKYGRPNALGDGGIPAPGERALSGRIHRRIPNLDEEGERWAGRTILLAGAGHSAQTAARDLAELGERHPGTRILWLVRGDDPAVEVIADDPLPLRRELAERAAALLSGASPAVEPLRGRVVDGLAEEREEEDGEKRGAKREGRRGALGVRLRRLDGSTEEVRVDRILSLTGGVGDHELYRQLQVHECYATSGPMKLAAALLGAAGGDCLTQESHGVEALVNPEPRFFVLGDKSYGRNSTFLLTVGWSQVEEVFTAVGDE